MADIPKTIAVVGGGVSGISAAYHIAKHGRNGTSVVLLEANPNRLGGHAWTYKAGDCATQENDVKTSESAGSLPPVDAGFMVCNHDTYPNLMRFFHDMEVPLEPTDMGFCVKTESNTWSFGSDWKANLRMLLKPRFWRWVKNMSRFHGEALADLKEYTDSLSKEENDKAGPDFASQKETIGEWLESRGYDESVVEGWIIPFCAAVWSSPLTSARDMDASSLFVFLRNHGFLTFSVPQWYTPKSRCGGSYLPRVQKWFEEQGVEVRLDARITGAKNHANGKVQLIGENGKDHGLFDAVIFATPAGALNNVVNKLKPEWNFLNGFRSHQSEVVLHSDKKVMPKERVWWSSWTVESNTLTYWLNKLQHLDGDQDVFETLNPTTALDKVHARFKLGHPIMDRKTAVSQRKYFVATSENKTSGTGNIRLAGAYLHHGFHEDGFRSGIEAARGVLQDFSIPLHPVPYARFHPVHHRYKGSTTHTRNVGIKRQFKYPISVDIVDVDGRMHFWWGGFFREDHFGDPAVPMGQAVREQVVQETGIYPSGVIDYCGYLRTYGVCFNPICFFLVWDGDERKKVDFILTEVTNTPWGQRCVHVLDMRSGSKDTLVRKKTLHVSPFNLVPDGDQLWEYKFHSLPPSGRMDVSVTLYDNKDKLSAREPTVTATMNVAKKSESAYSWFPTPDSVIVLFRIHWQAVVLLMRGMTFIDNTTTCPVAPSGYGFIQAVGAFLCICFALINFCISLL